MSFLTLNDKEDRKFRDTPSGEAVSVVTAEVNPTDATKVNPTITLSYNAAGDVIKITKVINTVTYEKTLSNADEVEASTKIISSWSEA